MTLTADRFQFLSVLVGPPLLVAVWLIAACQGTRVPANEWDESRFGPLVPHETFPKDCQLCHRTEGWTPLRDDFTFDHEAETGFPLEGAHTEALCLRCHNDRGPVAMYVARGCGGCHVDPHESTLGEDCTACHNQRTWRPMGQLAQHAETRFPLFGQHLAVPCELCHPQAKLGDFEGAPVDCDLCHLEDALRVRNPDHAANGWTHDCERCHTAGGFDRSFFAHETFPLIGAHAVIDCAACHQAGFRGTPRDCIACHEDDYLRTRDPNHVDAGFPTNCEVCHNSFAWEPAQFNHAGTRFPLTGAHIALDCQSCHADGFTGTPTDCFACHENDYLGTRDPNHVDAGFPTSCEVCHSTSAWEPAQFNHSFYPLTGGHAGVDCQSCHADGYQGTPRDCFACHADDYQGTRDPDHQAEGFPTTCELCHSITSWDDTSFDHQFPIENGRHSGLDCSSCHTVSFNTFSCIDCHAHTRSEMADEHDPDDVPGYQYNSSACYSCHPRGEED